MKADSFLSRIGKLFSKDSTNSHIGEVKITPEDGEREPFEVKLLSKPKPFIFRKTGKAKHQAVRLLVFHEGVMHELRVLTYTLNKKDKVVRMHNNFSRAWYRGTEFTGFLMKGDSPPQRVIGSIELHEPIALKSAA